MDDRSCKLCGKVFRDPATLKRHAIKKLPCVTTEQNCCPHCNRTFTTTTSKYRHIRQSCQVLKQSAITVQDLAAKVEELEEIIRRGSAQQVIQNNTVNHTVNNVCVTITPWGAPLQLTDADVEAALASIPGVAGTPALPEVVTALMELVKRAHMSEAARNVHLNPKRGDQALALTPMGGWAAMPLTEATAALFDGASARIAAPVARRRVNALYATVPVQYRADKAQAVALGLRPMEAHLANLAPGGPGPLLLEGPAVAAGAAAGAAAQPLLDPVGAAALVKRLPASYEPGGAVTAEWLAAVLAETGACAADLTRALRLASARGLCGFAEWQGIMRLGAPPAQ